MTDFDLGFLPALELRELMLAKQVSAVEVAETFIGRINRLDGQLNSYITTSFDLAMASARNADAAVMRGENLGPLHGIPISIKDLEMTAGIRSTAGSLVFEKRVPEADSIVCERVRGAGAVILGKTNTSEFGLLAETWNRLGDHCRNPWDTKRTTGGSSGGGAGAVAAGLCSIATGSDGGGSIRIPASYCGVFGIKPTQGRVPRYTGSTVAIANQTSQSGPLSRTVRDSALLLQVLSGHDRRDASSLKPTPSEYLKAAGKNVDNLRLAWSADYGYAAVDQRVITVAERAASVFGRMGCSVDESDLMLEDPMEHFWTIFSTNASAAYGTLLDSHADDLTEYARECIEYGRDVSGTDYAKAVGYIDELKLRFDDIFDKYDLLLSPTMAVTAFPVGEPPCKIAGAEVHPSWGHLPFTFPINLIGHPAASIPCGFSEEGLPVGLHVVGRRGSEETIIAASAAFESAQPWATYKPVVC